MSEYPYKDSKHITASEILYWRENPPAEVIASRERCNEAIGEFLKPMTDRLNSLLSLKNNQ